jgi:hypothetical protein
MQSVIKDRWVEAVEELLDRQVSCFLSANDPLKEIQIETFILEPVPAAEDGALAEIYTTHDE